MPGLHLHRGKLLEVHALGSCGGARLPAEGTGEAAIPSISCAASLLLCRERRSLAAIGRCSSERIEALAGRLAGGMRVHEGEPKKRGATGNRSGLVVLFEAANHRDTGFDQTS